MIRIYETLTIHIVLYGSEGRTVCGDISRLLRASEKRALRLVKGAVSSKNHWRMGHNCLKIWTCQPHMREKTELDGHIKWIDGIRKFKQIVSVKNKRKTKI